MEHIYLCRGKFRYHVHVQLHLIKFTNTMTVSASLDIQLNDMCYVVKSYSLKIIIIMFSPY